MSIKQNDMNIFSKRLETYKTWPLQIKQNPISLSSAGFFYTGINISIINFRH